jgi:hypothetical protein
LYIGMLSDLEVPPVIRVVGGLFWYLSQPMGENV